MKKILKAIDTGFTKEVINDFPDTSFLLLKKTYMKYTRLPDAVALTNNAINRELYKKRK